MEIEKKKIIDVLKIKNYDELGLLPYGLWKKTFKFHISSFNSDYYIRKMFFEMIDEGLFFKSTYKYKSHVVRYKFLNPEKPEKEDDGLYWLYFD